MLALQKRAFLQEAERYGDNYNITPITEKLPQMLETFKGHKFLKVMRGSLIVGSVRATNGYNGEGKNTGIRHLEMRLLI